ncbi:MAG: (2Fe-2S)-binding protein [Planctomycetes bacterium]|nr:(2Fe-2S)-binding protein [Planctomycetota bacterium]
MSQIRLGLDGKQIEVEPHTTLLQAAHQHGIEIPTLCHDDRLDPYGGCRLCLVEVDGAPRPVAACKTECADNMTVRTHSADLHRLRRTMLDMLLAEHYEDVGVKPNQLQELAAEHQLAQPSLKLGRRAAYDDRNQWIGFNPGACIMCDRCVRYCDEVMQCSALEHVGQGVGAVVQPTGRKSFLDTSCELCGGCVSTCPTGALYEKQAVVKRGEEVVLGGGGPIADAECEKTRSVCTFCGVGCVLDLNSKDGKVVKVTTDIGVGPNEGNLCNKGKFAFEFIHHSDRLTEPLVRGADGELHVTSWDDALQKVAAGMNGVKQRSGPDAIGFLASSRCTNEDVYIVQKIARAAIGTNNVHSCAAT